jgi:hypothetical protein
MTISIIQSQPLPVSANRSMVTGYIKKALCALKTRIVVKPVTQGRQASNASEGYLRSQYGAFCTVYKAVGGGPNVPKSSA